MDNVREDEEVMFLYIGGAMPESKLLRMEHVVLTPHVAWNSFEGVGDLHKEVTSNVVRVLHGEKPINIVNEKYLK